MVRSTGKYKSFNCKNILILFISILFSTDSGFYFHPCSGSLALTYKSRIHSYITRIFSRIAYRFKEVLYISKCIFLL